MQQNTKNADIPKVCILLSGYNGSKFIREQIDSLLDQKDVDIKIVVRDDGSSDDTVDIVRSYGGNIVLIEGKNLGCEKSFAELLKYHDDSDYYAFSDQDDYWLPDKVRSEVNAIKDIPGPALAACNLFLCKEDLTVERALHSTDEIEAIRNSMKENYLVNMHGCVLLWNRELHERLRNNIPDDIISHDGWVNTVANAVGTVIILEEPLIRYRIHGNNTAGHASTTYERAKKGIKLYLGKNHPHRDILAKEVLGRFGEDIDPFSNGYDTLCKIANYKSSLKARLNLMNKDIIRKVRFPDRLLWWLCILAGTY